MLLILIIALGVFLGILGWKAAKAGAKFLVFLAVVSGGMWLVGLILQNLLVFFFCIVAAVIIILAIHGAPHRHAINEEGRGRVAVNIAAKATGIYPSVAFIGYYSPWYNPFDMKHFVVAREGKTVWIIKFDPFSYEAIEIFQTPTSGASFEVKNQLLVDRVTIETPEKTITLNFGRQYRQEAGKLFDADLQPESKTFSEGELQEILYGEPEELTKRLKQWEKDPSSQPELEHYYKNYTSKGEGLPRPPQQWEKEAEDYIPRLDKAMSREKAGKTGDALEIYLNIIEQYNAKGTAYYERPAIILEGMGRLEEAVFVCEKALSNPYLVGSYGKFERRLNKLKKKIDNT